MTDRQTDGEGGQAAFAVAGVRQKDRQPGINRGKEVAKQTQCSTSVQIPARVGQCSRTDGQAGRGRAQTALLGAQISRTAPSSCLERKPGRVGSPSALLECVRGITAPGSSRTVPSSCRRQAGSRSTDGDHDSGVWCCCSN